MQCSDSARLAVSVGLPVTSRSSSRRQSACPIERKLIVTGAASGLGEMLANELARAGANLVLWDIDESGLHRVRNELVAAGFDNCVHLPKP